MDQQSQQQPILWPPPDVQYDGERVDLLKLIPPNRFDDYSAPCSEHKVVPGVTIRADRVILESSRYPDCNRSTQRILSDDIQACCHEQGHTLSVKEWADQNQHRGTLRLRLRCRNSRCRFQFQLNWDSKNSVWYISRRRCGTFLHTCQQATSALTLAWSSPLHPQTNKRFTTHACGGGAEKRPRLDPEVLGFSNKVHKGGCPEGPLGKGKKKKTQASRSHKKITRSPASVSNSGPEEHKAQEINLALSLLDFSKSASLEVGKKNEGIKAIASSPEGVASSSASAQPPPLTTATTFAPSTLASFVPIQIGDRIFLQPVNLAAPAPNNTAVNLSLLTAGAPNSASPPAAMLTTHQKLALLRGHHIGNAPASLSLTDPRFDLHRNRGTVLGLHMAPSGVNAAALLGYPTLHTTQVPTSQNLLQVDPRLLHSGLVLNGGVVQHL
jgi:hypothetical protein